MSDVPLIITSESLTRVMSIRYLAVVLPEPPETETVAVALNAPMKSSKFLVWSKSLEKWPKVVAAFETNFVSPNELAITRASV